MKIDKALDRLIGILPLKEKQEACGKEIKELHKKILNSFVEKGRILTKDEMATYVDDVGEAINVLKSNDMVVFSESGEPVGVYPFTMDEREHKVKINGHTVHAMCALDALSVSPMFNMDTQITSKCRVTDSPVFIKQQGKTIQNLEQAEELHFGIIWGAASSCSCCANSLCMEMMFLKDNDVAQKWKKEDDQNREVFTLAEAVEFGSRFFVPLMS